MFSSSKAVSKLAKHEGHSKATTTRNSKRKRMPGKEEEMFSSPRAALKFAKCEGCSEATPAINSKRKCTPVKEEASNDTTKYGDNLVGLTIKVWWPNDQMFYEAVVDYFDPVKKNHRILYKDGDQETLNLRKERWEPVGGDSSDVEQAMEDHIADPSLEMNAPAGEVAISPPVSENSASAVVQTSSARAAPGNPSTGLPSKTALFMGVSPDFLPYLHDLYVRHGHIFSCILSEPDFVKAMDLQFLGVIMQSLDKKPLGELSFEEIEHLCQSLAMIRFSHLDIGWLKEGMQKARNSLKASHMREDLARVQGDIKKAQDVLQRLKSDEANLLEHATAFENLSDPSWSFSQSICKNLLQSG